MHKRWVVLDELFPGDMIVGVSSGNYSILYNLPHLIVDIKKIYGTKAKKNNPEETINTLEIGFLTSNNIISNEVFQNTCWSNSKGIWYTDFSDIQILIHESDPRFDNALIKSRHG